MKRLVRSLLSAGVVAAVAVVPLAVLDAQMSGAAGSESCTSPSGHSFSDVPSGSYYNTAVGWLVGAAVTSGTSPGHYSPSQEVTRAQMAVFLWRAAGEPYVDDDPGFGDVPPGSYFETAVAWLVQAGVTTGTAPGTYSPDQKVTRAQMAVFLWRAAGEPQPDGDPGFGDVPPGSYFETAVAWLVQAGVTTGTAPGTYSPSQKVTRGQMAVFLFRSGCGTSIAGAELIDTGGHVTCAVVSGAAKCWGNGIGGKLGNGVSANSSAPVGVSGLSSGVTRVDVGGGHSCARLNDATVKCWGGGNEGQLGDNTAFNRSTPVAVTGLTDVTDVAAGGQHSCAVVTGGTVKCWGDNYYGQIGDGTNLDRWAPVAVTGLTGVVAVDAGDHHTCARLSNGTAKCWGRNFAGMLGDGTETNRTTPTTVSSLSGVKTMALGSAHTCAVLVGGDAKCWGSDSNGQLGDGDPFENRQRTPTTVVGLSGAIAISASFSRTCAALSGGGTAKCWGENTYGGLGDGTNTSRETPTSVSNLAGVSAITSAGHSCVLLTSGAAKCWGLNDEGELGDGTLVNRNTPVSVVGL